MALMTPTRKKTLIREQKIADEYNRLIAQPGNMKVACELAVMKKFGIKSRTSVYNIVNRVEARSINS